MQIRIDAEKLKQIKLWILVPAAGDMIHATFSNCLIALTELLRSYGVTSRVIYLPGDSLVTRARNNLAHLFLQNSSDPENHFCLWLDCDILFQPESVLQMLALDMDFVTAPYSKKGIHHDRIAEAARLNWPNDRMMAVSGSANVNWLVNPLRMSEPIPVLEAGTGFWLLKRKVFTQMQEGLTEIKFRRSNEEHAHYGEFGYDYFRVGIWPETREYLSEDWWFCREWRKLGGTVYCCFWIKTNHIGPFMYPMDMPAISDLLTATGGYVNAETRPKKEVKDATTQVRTGPTEIRANGKCSGIDRAILALLGQADKTAIPSNPGSLGDRAGD